MPLVKVEMLKGKSNEFKKTVLDCIHDGLMDSIGIEDWDRFQRIAEYEKSQFEIPSFKSDDFMIIELTMFPGRTKEQKEKVIEMITDNLNKRLSIAPGASEYLFCLTNATTPSVPPRYAIFSYTAFETRYILVPARVST